LKSEILLRLNTLKIFDLKFSITQFRVILR
jgi:hypothetical protein